MLEWFETTCPCPDPLRAVNPICQTHGYLPAPVPPATMGGTDEAEGLALAELLHFRFEGTGTYCRWESRGLCPAWWQARHAADALLASDWLAARDARTRADALREAADEIRFTEQEHAEWLRDRADQIGGAS